MPRGSTESPYGLRERKRMAFDLFARGFDNTQVAERLEVGLDTVARYRSDYEEELQRQLQQNPQLLRNVLENTVRALEELDQVRRAAWEEYERTGRVLRVECPECEHEFLVEGAVTASATTRNAILGQITKAQELRAKLLGLFGVKQEFLLHVQSVRVIQEAILEFMRRELCAEDKRKLEQLLTHELSTHVGTAQAMPTLAALDVG